MRGGFVSFLGTMRLNEHKGPFGSEKREEGGLMAFVVKLQLLVGRLLSDPTRIHSAR